MEGYPNILVIKSGALGDLIAGTTAIRAIREAYPRSRITLLTNRLMSEICPAGTIYDDAIFTDGERDSPRNYLGEILELRKRKFDLVVNLRWASEGSALLAMLSGAKGRVGSGPRSARWTYTVKAPWHGGRRHEFLRHLDVVGALGIPAAIPEPFLYVSEADVAFANAFFESIAAEKGNFLVLHPGASIRSKAWPAWKYAELGKLFLREFPAKVVVTWGPGEQPVAGEIVDVIGERARLAPQTTIAGLGAIIAGSRMCVCNYSGVMNVGMAVKTPLIALGCTSPEDWGPYGGEHRTVSAFIGRDSYTDIERAGAMNSISVESVWNVLSTRWRDLTSQPAAVTV